MKSFKKREREREREREKDMVQNALLEKTSEGDEHTWSVGSFVIPGLCEPKSIVCLRKITLINLGLNSQVN